MCTGLSPFGGVYFRILIKMLYCFEFAISRKITFQVWLLGLCPLNVASEGGIQLRDKKLRQQDHHFI